MLAVSFEGEQSMSMVVELAVITRNDITVERYQFQHSLNLLRLEAATLWDKHLQFGTTAPTYARENGRWDGLFMTDFEEIADNLIASIHPDIVRFTNLLVFHNLINYAKSGYKFTNYSAIITIFAVSFKCI